MLYTFKDLLVITNAPCRLCGKDNRLYLANGNAMIMPEVVMDGINIGGYQFEIETTYRSPFSIIIQPNTNQVFSNQSNKVANIEAHFVIECNECKTRSETANIAFKPDHFGWLLNPLSIHYEHIVLAMDKEFCYIDSFVSANRSVLKFWRKTEYGVVQYSNAIDLPVGFDPFMSKAMAIQKIELIRLLGS